MRIFLSLIVMLCTLTSVQAADIAFPELTGRVVDQAGLLDVSAKAQLEQKLADYERESSNQIVVVTLTTLQGQPIEDYGYKLGRHWQLGQKERNNGAILLVVPSERQVRIEVGYGLEPVLTDAASRIIIERIILPHFREKDIAGGITAGVDAMIAATRGEFQGLPQKTTPAEDSAISIGGFIFLLLLIWMMRRATRGGYSSGLSLLPLILSSGGGYSGSQGSGFGGGGGSFGGGGASGRW